MMNPDDVGGNRAFNELYVNTDPTKEEEASEPGPSNLPKLPQKRPVEEDDDHQLSLDEKVAKLDHPDASSHVMPAKESDPEAKKIYVGGLPPNITEKPLNTYFSNFGEIVECKVIRDRDTGISRGFAFITFICESMAETAISTTPHIMEGRQIRVSAVAKPGEQPPKPKTNSKEILEELIIPVQNRIYIGPLDESILGDDLMKQFSQFGPILALSRLKSSETQSKVSYGFIDFRDSIAMRKAFGAKVFVKGKHVKVALSRFAMEVILNKSTVFFYEAFVPCEEKPLEQHFSKFGQVFRCAHLRDLNGLHKTYGFVDFVSKEAADRAVNQKSQLLPPGQFVKVSKFLPQANLFDLFAIGDIQGNEIIKKLEQRVPNQGSWGVQDRTAIGVVTTTKVRIPSNLVGKLIGERGKTITEISRDSKTIITIPKTEEGQKSVILEVKGTKDNIRTAQYLMQRVIKPR